MAEWEKGQKLAVGEFFRIRFGNKKLNALKSFKFSSIH